MEDSQEIGAVSRVELWKVARHPSETLFDWVWQRLDWEDRREPEDERARRLV